MVAAEAVLRWDHPQLGIISSPEVLRLAEDAGLMRPVTRLLLRGSITQCAAWGSAGKPLMVSVSLPAADQLDPYLTYLVRELLEIHRVPPQALALEITQARELPDVDAAARVIQELRDLGVTVMIASPQSRQQHAAPAHRIPGQAQHVEMGSLHV